VTDVLQFMTAGGGGPASGQSPRRVPEAVLEAITSGEAREASPDAAQVYLCLFTAPAGMCGRDGLLLTGTEDGGDGGARVSAWETAAGLVPAPPEAIFSALWRLDRRGLVRVGWGDGGREIRITFPGGAAGRAVDDRRPGCGGG
jgi:hypothetical protein